jgi:hypothetical protein
MEKGQVTALLYGLVAILNINEKVLFWFCIIMCFDMALGAIKAIVIPELKFTLKVFFFGMLRKITLLTMVLFFASLAIGLGFEDIKEIITYFIKALMIAEGISVFYCFKSILNNKEFRAEDFISKIIDKIIKILGNLLERTMKALDNNQSCF